jgi:hypothetical protein
MRLVHFFFQAKVAMPTSAMKTNCLFSDYLICNWFVAFAATIIVANSALTTAIENWSG